jgi:hypothetical protein
MSQLDPTVVRDWIALQHAEEGSPEYERLLDAHDLVSDLVEESPDVGWLFVLEVLRIDSSTAVRETLSAGPLEDLLARHGAQMIERVEREAQSNPQFASLLGGVWKNAMPDHVWERVQMVWDRRGWDGVPAA